LKALAIFRRGRFLKFQHVLVSVDTGNGIVTLDTAGGGIHLGITGATLEEVAQYYRSSGDAVVECEASPCGSQFTVVGTCVEVVKRVLGIRGFFILTPYQLYRRLTWFSKHPNSRRRSRFRREPTRR